MTRSIGDDGPRGRSRLPRPRRIALPMLMALVVPFALASSCSGGDDGSNGEGTGSPSISLSPVPNSGPPQTVEGSKTHVLHKETAPAGLELQRVKKSEPTPGAGQGWIGGWTTQSFILSPGQQKGGWEWAQSSVNVYEDATTASHAYRVTRDYVVSAYAGNGAQTDPNIGDESVAVEGREDPPDVTVIWRENNALLSFAGFGGAPLTNDDIIAFAGRLNEGALRTRSGA